MARYSVFVFGLAIVASRSQESPTCQTQLSACACETDQGLVDLKPLDSNDPNKPQFTEQPRSADIFSYNPCSPFRKNDCDNVAACLTRGLESYNIGVQDTATFETDPSDGRLRIRYSTRDGSHNRTSYVDLVCSESEEGLLIAHGEIIVNSDVYGFTLISKYACPVGEKWYSWKLLSIVLGALLVVLIVSCISCIIYKCCVKTRRSDAASCSSPTNAEREGMLVEKGDVKETSLTVKRDDVPGCAQNANAEAEIGVQVHAGPVGVAVAGRGHIDQPESWTTKCIIL